MQYVSCQYVYVRIGIFLQQSFMSMNTQQSTKKQVFNIMSHSILLNYGTVFYSLNAHGHSSEHYPYRNYNFDIIQTKISLKELSSKPKYIQFGTVICKIPLFKYFGQSYFLLNVYGQLNKQDSHLNNHLGVSKKDKIRYQFYFLYCLLESNMINRERQELDILWKRDICILRQVQQKKQFQEVRIQKELFYGGLYCRVYKYAMAIQGNLLKHANYDFFMWIFLLWMVMSTTGLSQTHLNTAPTLMDLLQLLATAIFVLQPVWLQIQFDTLWQKLELSIVDKFQLVFVKFQIFQQNQSRNDIFISYLQFSQSLNTIIIHANYQRKK
eukprot:TRINITY_DN5597_c0_g2_i3.p2 TRINITY_DN5597_c0_g2~~TRINITY_DN5597_c0_g2_i3.p2  ORF type:complete len:325 (-),score=-10.79 TRINITY_DN5597_c0_g2_i3:813-1787(-)